MQNSMVMFIFSLFDQKYPFSTNLIQKFKIISWSWNLVPTLIPTCRIQWWDSLLLFLIGNTLFEQIRSKKSKLSVELKFGTYTNSNMQNSMVIFTFFDRKYPFWANFVQKVRLISWSWNLVPKLIRISRIQ